MLLFLLTTVDSFVDFLCNHVQIDVLHVEIFDETLQSLLYPDGLDLSLGAVPLDDVLLLRFL